MSGVPNAPAFLITMAEGGALHLDRLKGRADDFDPAARDRLTAGALLLAPSTPCSAPPMAQTEMTVGDRTPPVHADLGINTQPISVIGLPVAAVPVWAEGEALPMRMQVIGPPWREDFVLRARVALGMAGIVRAPVAAL